MTRRVGFTVPARRPLTMDDVGELVTKGDVSRLFGVSVRTVSRMIKHKELRATRVGRMIRIPRDEIRAWLVRGQQ